MFNQIGRMSHEWNFIGSSVDIKPTLSQYPDMPAGARFHELNTGIKYIFDGTNWLIYNLLELAIATKLGM